MSILQLHQPNKALPLEELDDAGQIVSIMISIPLYVTFLMTESTYKTKKIWVVSPVKTTHVRM